MQGREGPEGGGDLRAHLLHGLQLLQRDGPEGRQRGVGLRQQLRGAHAHHGDAQGVDPAGQGFGARPVQGLQQVLGGLLRHAVQARQVGQAGARVLQQGHHIPGLLDAPRGHNLLHQGVPHAFDVQGRPAPEVEEAAHQLGGALGVEAADGHLGVVRLAHFASAHGAGDGNGGQRQVSLGLARHQGHHLGDDLPALLDEDPVAHPQPQTGQLVHIVQRGSAHGGARHLHRFQLSHGGELPAAPHLPGDAQHRGGHLGGRELEGDGPAGHPVRGAHGCLGRRIQHLEHHAIGVEGQAQAILGLGGDKAQHVLHGTHGRAGHAREAPGRQQGHGRLLIALEQGRYGTVPEQLPGQERESPCCDLPAVQQLHGAAGGIAGIGEAGLAPGIALAVELLPALAGQKDLAPHRELSRCLRRQAQRDVSDGAGVLRHQLAGLAIAPGEGLHQQSVLVAQGQGEAVHLELGGVARGGFRRQLPPADLPLGELRGGVGVVQAEHGHGVAALLEGVHRRCAHALGGTVGIGVLRMGRLQVPQLALQGVVFRIRDRGLVQHIVAMAMGSHLARQVRHSLSQVAHFSLARCWIPMMMPRARKKLRVLLPPALKKGRTMPLLGRAPATMPTFTRRCRAKMPAAPAQK